jgi:hypothetical protein
MSMPYNDAALPEESSPVTAFRAIAGEVDQPTGCDAYAQRLV